MTNEPNYARAVARYLATAGYELPDWFNPELATHMRCHLTEGHNYSSYTFEDPEFDLWLYSENDGADTQRPLAIDLREVDLPELISQAVNHL